MADVSVRPARPPDAERVARVQLSTWGTAYADLLPAPVLETPLEQVAAVWLNAIEAPPTERHGVLVALDGGELVGFAAMTPSPDDDLPDGTVELATVLVEPRWGRRGHGSRLLAACVDTWRAQGATLATTWGFERDVATLTFLTSAGWAADGASRGLDTGPRVQHQRRYHASLEEQ